LKDCIQTLLGQELTSQRRVLSHQTAATFAESEGEQYAEVLGTPFLVAEMEKVCAKIIEPLLKPGEVSVGAHIDVRHLASTAVESDYWITATLLEHKWGLFTFNVEAKDSVGFIGKGKIVRAIASLESINRRAVQALQSH